MSGAWSSRPGLASVRVRDSLWLLPSVVMVVGTGLAMVAVQVPTPRPESWFAWVWLFGGAAEGARGVLTSIAGSLITVTATVFSLTIVALHSTADGDELFVPQFGVTVALVLLLVSVGALVMFIKHAAQSIRASVILHRETRGTLAQIAELFPEDIGEPASGETPEECTAGMEGPPGVIRARESGYLAVLAAARLSVENTGDPAGVARFGTKARAAQQQERHDARLS